MKPGVMPVHIMYDEVRVTGWAPSRPRPPCVDIGLVHASMLRVNRVSSVLGPYFSPRPEHRRYMAANSESQSNE